MGGGGWVWWCDSFLEVFREFRVFEVWSDACKFVLRSSIRAAVERAPQRACWPLVEST